MELYFVDSDGDKMNKKKNSCWHNALILGGLLLAFNLAAYLTQLSPDGVRRSLHECAVTMAVKFLNFCIAKSVQFRHVAPLQTQSSFMSLVFWFVLTRSVSSLYSGV